jgi:hypothetical protein
MENNLPILWYVESPIDFEHKQYVLFAYLQKVDMSFSQKILSPHLLHLEKVIDELNYFSGTFNMIKNDFNKNRYIYLENVKLVGEDDKFILEIKDIVEFAIPQIDSRIKTGYKIFQRNNQILF